MQWKVDWALRWFALQVDYELYGKDLIDSARLSGQIVRLLGGKPPLGFAYEMFLDEEGHKVSKSVGRGVTVDQWQRYAPIEVLKYFLILNPRRARKLFLEAIPQYVDEYLDELRAYAQAAPEPRRSSDLEFVLQPDSVRSFRSELSYGLIMNLVSALGTSDTELIWNYLTHYDPGINGDDETRALAGTLVECALNFYRDFVEPTKHRHAPDAAERAQIEEIVRFPVATSRRFGRGNRKGNLRGRPAALRQAGQNLPPAVQGPARAKAGAAAGSVHQAGDATENRQSAPGSVGDELEKFGKYRIGQFQAALAEPHAAVFAKQQFALD